MQPTMKNLRKGQDRNKVEELEKSGGGRWSGIAAFRILPPYGICLWKQ